MIVNVKCHGLISQPRQPYGWATAWEQAWRNNMMYFGIIAEEGILGEKRCRSLEWMQPWFS